MKLSNLCILFAFPALISCFGRTDKKLKESAEQVQRKEFSIVDGNQVDQGTEHVRGLGLNSVVQIGVGGKSDGHCTATRIGTRYFLTAAHCVDDFQHSVDNSYNVTIRRGSNAASMQVINGLRFARLENIDFIHPDRRLSNESIPGRNDVAVLVLKPQTFNPDSLEELDKKLKDIDIAEYGDPIYFQSPGMNVRAAGYGFTELYEQTDPKGRQKNFWDSNSDDIFSWIDINLGFAPVSWGPLRCSACSDHSYGVVWTDVVDVYEPTPANFDAILQKKTRIALLKRRAAEIQERINNQEASEDELAELGRLQAEISQLESLYKKYNVQTHDEKNYLVNSPLPSAAGGDSGGPLFYNGKVVAVNSGMIGGDKVTLTNDVKDDFFFQLVTPQPVLIPELEDATLTRMHGLYASIDKYWINNITTLPVIDHIASDEELEKSNAGQGSLEFFQGEWITVVGNNLLTSYGQLNADQISFGTRNYSPFDIKFVVVKAPSSQSAVQIIKILVPNDADSGHFRFEYRDWISGKKITPVVERKIVIKPKEWVLFSELSVMPDTGFPRLEYEDFGASLEINGPWSGGISSKWDTESKKSFVLPGIEWLGQAAFHALLTNRFISRSALGEIIDDRFFKPETHAFGSGYVLGQYMSDVNAKSPKTFEDATSMYELSYFDTWDVPETRTFSGSRYIRQTIRNAESLYCDLEIEISVPEIFGDKTFSETNSGVQCIGYPTSKMMEKY